MKSRLHYWLPDLMSAKGGIQEFSNRLLEAIVVSAPDTELTVFAKNDCPANTPLAGARPYRLHCSGQWPGKMRTAAFGSQLLFSGIRDRPDAIVSTHLHFSPAARWIKRLRKVPYAVVAHGIDAWGLSNPGVIAGLRSANLVLAVSEYTRASLIRELSLPPDQVAILPNTVNSERFLPGPKPGYLLHRLGLRADHPVILTVCRMPSVERYKGYDQILRALPEIRRRVPRVRYVLGGSGQDAGRVRQMIHELDLEEVVLMPGFIPDAELCDYYNLADVFAMPSKAEGFGIVFLEALACGKPVLAGNCDGSVDAVLQGAIGCLVNPDSVREIADALVGVLLGTHPMEILRQPTELRRRMLAAYGFDRFTETVRGHLKVLGLKLSA